MENPLTVDHEIAVRVRELHLKQQQLAVTIEEEIRPRKEAIADLERQIAALATEDPNQGVLEGVL